jgi:hypothetical protein
MVPHFIKGVLQDLISLELLFTYIKVKVMHMVGLFAAIKFDSLLTFFNFCIVILGKYQVSSRWVSQFKKWKIKKNTLRNEQLFLWAFQWNMHFTFPNAIHYWGSIIVTSVTKPPWLHQFHLGWTCFHPSYQTWCSQTCWIKVFFCLQFNL